MNIAINIRNMLPNVNDAGSNNIFSGEYNGIMMPIAHRSAEMTIFETPDLAAAFITNHPKCIVRCHDT